MGVVKNILFYQLFESTSSTYTYLLADPLSREAVIIDPVLETTARDLQLIEELQVQLKYILETHIHADHITGADVLRQKTKARVGISVSAGIACADLQLRDHDEIPLGSHRIQVRATPGHTNTCLSYFIDGRVFTGDALLIRGTGRTDFQEGSSDRLFESIHQKIFSLPEETQVYPGHDYKGQTSSTVGMEKKFNPRVGGGKTKDEFKKIMANLNLSHPQKMAIAVPANKACGKIMTVT